MRHACSRKASSRSERRHAISLLLMFFLVSPSLLALTPHFADHVCAQISSPDLKRKCFDESENRYLDIYAAGACANTSDDRLISDCMSIVAGHRFDRDAVEVCDSLTAKKYAVQCLASIVDASMDSHSVAACGHVRQRQKISCLQTIKGLYFSKKDVVECKSLRNEERIECFKQYADNGEAVPIESMDSTKDCAQEKGARFFWADPGASQCEGICKNGVLVSGVDPDRCARSGLALGADGRLMSIDTFDYAGKAYHYLPMILQMGDDVVLPKRIFDDYDSILIGASLVERLHLRHETEDNVDNPTFDYMRDAIPTMRFDDSDIGNILKGGFQNQHQTAKSHGYLGGSLRAGMEDYLMRLKLEETYDATPTSHVQAVRPKYAFLGFQSDPDGQHNSNFINQFGNVVAVFNNDVKKRAMFTANDSLVIYNADKSKLMSFTYQYRSQHPLHKIPDASYDLWETQIYGSLSMRDVAYFLVNCPGDTPIPNSSLQRLETANLPIYQCVPAADKSHLGRGNMLFAGDPSRVVAYPGNPRYDGRIGGKYSSRLEADGGVWRPRRGDAAAEDH